MQASLKDAIDHEQESLADCFIVEEVEASNEEQTNVKRMPKTPTVWDDSDVASDTDERDIEDRFPVHSAGRQTFGSTRHLKNYTIRDSKELADYARWEVKRGHEKLGSQVPL